MSKHSFIIVLGVMVALTPLLGFPRDWEPQILVLLGILIIFTELFRVVSDKYESMVSDLEREGEGGFERRDSTDDVFSSMNDNRS